jgi:AcrR family transcriptional regulator
VEVVRRKRTVKSAPERRRELLEAALQVFRTRGAGAATVEDITVTARVAKGTFYRYFTSKEDIIAALRARVGDDMLARVAERAGSSWTTPAQWWNAVDVMIDVFIDYLLDQADEHRALWHSSAERVVTNSEDQFLDRLATLVAEATRGGIFACDDPKLTVVALFGAFHALADHALASTTIERARVVAEARRLARRALAPSTATP